MGQAIDKLLATVGNPKSQPLPTPQPQPGIFSKANNFVQNLSSHVANFGEGALSPASKLVASGIQAIESTPDIAKGVYQAATSPNLGQALLHPTQPLLNTPALTQANQKMAQPVNLGLTSGPQATLGGSTNVQNLGSAAQAASFLAPETGLGTIGGGAVAGGLQVGGQTAENPNATASGVATGTALGALGGAGIGTLSEYAPEALQKILPKDNKVPEITPEVQAAQQELNQAQQGVNTAQVERTNAAPQAVQGTSDVQSGVQSGERNLGVTFGQAPAKIEATDPSLRYNLSQKDLTDLNTIKEDRKFSLPDYLDQEKTPQPNIAGQNLDMNKMSPKVRAQIEAATGKMQGETAQSLTPTQTQDLVRQLNGKTYNPVTGEVDNRIIDLTNRIKSGAQSSFGHIVDENGESVWNKAYQDYTKGMQTTDNLKTIIGINPNKSLSDISPNKILEKVLDLGKTPEGKLQLQNAVDEFKNQTGVDLTDPVKAMHQILDKQIALEDAQSDLKESQKGLTKAQKEAKIAESNKGKGLKNFGKYTARSAASGAIRIWALYPAIRAITKAISGK